MMFCGHIFFSPKRTHSLWFAYDFQLRDRVDGSASDMEFYAGTVRCICIGKKEGAP